MQFSVLSLFLAASAVIALPIESATENAAGTYRPGEFRVKDRDITERGETGVYKHGGSIRIKDREIDERGEAGVYKHGSSIRVENREIDERGEAGVYKHGGIIRIKDRDNATPEVYRPFEFAVSE